MITFINRKYFLLFWANVILAPFTLVSFLYIAIVVKPDLEEFWIYQPILLVGKFNFFITCILIAAMYTYKEARRVMDNPPEEN